MAKQIVPTSKHQMANAAYLAGDYQKAISLQVEVVNDHIKKGKQAVTARKLLALYLYTARDFEAAIGLLKTLEEEVPTDSEVPENIGVMLRQSGKTVDAVKYLLKAHGMDPKKSNVCDGLAHCFHSLNEAEQTQKFGRLSLELKDTYAATLRTWEVPAGVPPEFNFENPDRNIISFSLFGSNPRYLHGALRNARLAPDLYPGWTCRFYCDPEVPKTVLDQLADLGCQIEMRARLKNFYEGLLWRFEVIDDPTVDRFLVRDCDSVINIKERVAVDEWIASDKWFHAMRDFPSHTEVILAGMWGGVSGVLPTVQELVDDFSPQTAATRTYDQHLLREKVWPTIRQSVLIHDSVYTGCLGSVPFPEVGQLPPDRHVGQNEAAVIDQEKLEVLQPNKAETLERFFILGLEGSGSTYLQQMLDAHPGILCSPEHQLSTVWKQLGNVSEKYQTAVDRSGARKGLMGQSLDQKKLKSELYLAWLEHLFVHYAGDGITHVGINDNNLDSNLVYHAGLFPKATFIYIARDPRDAAVAIWQDRKKNDPGFDRDGIQLTKIASSIGKDWSEKLRKVQSFNENHPGKIELVRYEDLFSNQSGQVALKRLLKFLKVEQPDSHLKAMAAKAAEATVAKVEIGAWKDTLTVQQVDLIQKDAAKLMTLLRYELCEIDYRAIEAGDTILPS
ncbi:MAG: sulfotransferase [Verrucomicrobiales bacterium]|nr:sulfotransferase [Verrucomicrobiales bacterium]